MKQPIALDRSLAKAAAARSTIDDWSLIIFGGIAGVVLSTLFWIYLICTSTSRPDAELLGPFGPWHLEARDGQDIRGEVILTSKEEGEYVQVDAQPRTLLNTAEAREFGNVLHRFADQRSLRQETWP